MDSPVEMNGIVGLGNTVCVLLRFPLHPQSVSAVVR